MKILKYYIIFIFLSILVLFNSNSIYASVFDSMESESLLHSNLSSTFDESSLFFNPTVISKSKMYELHSNDKTFSSLSLVSSFTRGSSPFYSMVSATSSVEIKDLFKDDSFQKTSFLLLKQMQLKDSYYLTIGFFSKAMVYSMNLKDYFGSSNNSNNNSNEINTNTDTNISIKSTDKIINSLSDSGMVINIPIISYENRINMALGIWGVYRAGISTIVDQELSQDKINSFFNKGFMYGADLGIGYVFNDFWSPSIGVVLSNISGKCVENYLGKYEERSVCGATIIGNGIKDFDSYEIVEPTNLKVGASINPRFSKNFSIRFNSTLENIHLSIGTNDYYDPSKSSIISSSVEALFGNPFKNTPVTLSVAFNSESIVYTAKINVSKVSLSFSHVEEEKDNLIPNGIIKDNLPKKNTESNTFSKYLVGMNIRF